MKDKNVFAYISQLMQKKINPKWTTDLNLICKTIDRCRKIQEKSWVLRARQCVHECYQLYNS